MPIATVFWQYLRPGGPFIHNFTREEVATWKEDGTFLLVIKDVDKSFNGAYVFAKFLNNNNEHTSLVLELNLRGTFGPLDSLFTIYNHIMRLSMNLYIRCLICI